MPDQRKHRGPNPLDQKLFNSRTIPTLKRAVSDYSLLLTMGYADKSALKLVGDHYALTTRQRLALMRASCADNRISSRMSNEVKAKDLNNQPIVIDGYNILITIEAALSLGPIFHCRDTCFRDIASVHGSYRKVEETIPALNLIAQTLTGLKIADALFLLDRPVSNSGKLKTLMKSLAQEKDYPWQIELVTNPDKKLIETESIIATSDSHVLDQCKQWTNLTSKVIKSIKQTWQIDLA